MVLFFGALQHTSVAIAVLTHYLAPVLIALFGPVCGVERFRLRTFMAITLAFGGLALLLAPWEAGRHAGDLVGAGLGAGSAVFSAANVLITKRLSGSFSASQIMFFAGLISLPILCLLVSSGDLTIVSTRSLMIVALGGVGPGALAGLIFFWGLWRVPATHASVLTLLEPLVAVVLAAVILGQAVGTLTFAGGAAILVGALLVITGATGISTEH